MSRNYEWVMLVKVWFSLITTFARRKYITEPTHRHTLIQHIHIDVKYVCAQQYKIHTQTCSLRLNFCFNHKALYIILNTFLTHVNNIHAVTLKNLQDVVNEEKLQYKLHVKYAIHTSIKDHAIFH